VMDTLNLLPGPVPVCDDVKRAFLAEPNSHRSATFRADIDRARALLCRIAGSRHAQMLLGSGTLANDVIAAQLALLPGRGLILTNGEFGERLVDHAVRFRLAHGVLAWPWGEPFDGDAVARMVKRERPAWVWCVQLETSTGIGNDVEALASICRMHDARLCVDAVSAFGTMPVALGEAYLASAVSGKGAGAFSGLAIVFYNHDIEPSDSLPRYLDLGLYARHDGVPFTHSSNLVNALTTSLERIDWERRFDRIRDGSSWLRSELRASGFTLVAPEAHAAPGVVSIALPEGLASAEVAHRLEQAGYFIAGNSEYLLQRNWIQISLMGDPPLERLVDVVRVLRIACSQTVA
jgi:aspartate aminotransferase-like enzyme